MATKSKSNSSRRSSRPSSKRAPSRSEDISSRSFSSSQDESRPPRMSYGQVEGDYRDEPRRGNKRPEERDWGDVEDIRAYQESLRSDSHRSPRRSGGRRSNRSSSSARH